RSLQYPPITLLTITPETWQATISLIKESNDIFIIRHFISIGPPGHTPKAAMFAG
ncbi:hypothetical protein WUBG_10148, partial [Wuchereria bancrofti]